MIDIQGLYDSLLDASYAGILIDIIDSRDETGRRVQKILFPGIDQAAFQDLGSLDGPIRITGVLAGDDYVHQADRLRAAFKARGQKTLVHPWLGELLVVLVKGGEISFVHDELRIARFSAEFERFVPYVAPTPDTLQGVLDAIADLKAQARALLRQVLAPVALALSAVSYVQRFASQAKGIWDIVTGDNDIVSQLAAPFVALLNSVSTIPAGNGYPDAVCDALAGVSNAIAASSISTPPSVIAPGGPTTAAPTVDPRIPARMILAAIDSISIAGTGAGPAAGLLVVTRMLALADAVQAASDIPFESQQEAQSWRDQLVTRLADTTDQAAVLAASLPVEAGTAWRSLQAARVAVVADFSSVIGRLPAVTTITPPATVSAWVLANYLSGDTPEDIVATYLDLVARNKLRHAALAPAVPLETLQ